MSSPQNIIDPSRAYRASNPVISFKGTGISAERLPHLFRKFSRTDGHNEGSGSGSSGLGLAICKGIVEAHGGRIWAESDGLGQGARFTFTIPVVEEAGMDATIQSPRLATRSQQEASEEDRILVVDDDASSPTYIFAEPRVGYRMPKGREPEQGTE